MHGVSSQAFVHSTLSVHQERTQSSKYLSMMTFACRGIDLMSDDSPDCARDSIDLLYLDQGALLNLLVIGQASDILQALPYQCLITEGIRDAAYRFWGNALISELLPEGPQRTLSTLLLQGHLAIRSCDKLASLSTYLKLASRFPEPRASLLTLTVTMHAALL